MKRFHVHVAVHDIKQSIRFYSTLFGSRLAQADVSLLPQKGASCCAPAIG